MPGPASSPQIFDPARRRRWPAPLAALAPLIAIPLPVTVARRLDHLPLGLAWVVHVAAGLLCVLITLMLAALDNLPHGLPPVESILLYPDELADVIVDVAKEFTGRHANEVWVGTAIAIFFIELGYVIGAWILAPWGARPEPMWHSNRRALARLWLTTSHAAAYIVAFIGAIIAWDRWGPDWMWEDKWLGGISLWQLEQLAQMAWYACLLLVATVMLLWIVGAGRRWGAQCRWPAHCEGCGYNLMGMRKDQACPECGRCVADTLTDQSRPGIGGGSQAVAQLPLYIQKNMWLALVRPGRLGGRLQLLTPTIAHAWAAAIGLGLAALVAVPGLLGVWITVWITDGYYGDDWVDFIQEFCSTYLGSLITLLHTAPLVVLTAASVVGLSARVAHKRNLLPVAIQGTCYLTSLLPIWVAMQFLWIMLMIVLAEWIERVTSDYTLITLIFSSIFLLHGLMLFLYLFLLGRIVWAAKHANR